jgi:hypothetical protein
MNGDPILALQSLGYTEREASFLYLVANHSGYFLRRQFDYFIDRNKGAIAQNFLEKGRAAGHLEVIDYGESRHVYHLFAKQIYRLFGNAESQNRRRKGDGLIRARLIALDYVLEHDRDHYLETIEDRIHFFGDVRRISPQLFSDRHGKIFSSLASYPISLVDRTRPMTSLVRFLFADEALLSTAKFHRFLSGAERLLRALETFELVYASNSAHNFAEAESAFQNRFAVTSPAKQGYLDTDWQSGHLHEDPKGSHPFHARFTTLLLHANYPKIRRSESRSLGIVRPTGPGISKKTTTKSTVGGSGGSYAG